MVCWIDSLELRNCIWPIGTIIFMGMLMFHKSDKVPYLSSLVVKKSGMCIHDLSDRYNRDPKITVDYLIAHLK